MTMVIGPIQLYLDVALKMDIDHLLSFPKALYLLQTSRKQERELNAMSDELEIEAVRTRRNSCLDGTPEQPELSQRFKRCVQIRRLANET